jgi:hypothetical protein
MRRWCGVMVAATFAPADWTNCTASAVVMCSRVRVVNVLVVGTKFDDVWHYVVRILERVGEHASLKGNAGCRGDGAPGVIDQRTWSHGKFIQRMR